MVKPGVVVLGLVEEVEEGSEEVEEVGGRGEIPRMRRRRAFSD